MWWNLALIVVSLVQTIALVWVGTIGKRWYNRYYTIKKIDTQISIRAKNYLDFLEAQEAKKPKDIEIKEVRKSMEAFIIRDIIEYVKQREVISEQEAENRNSRLGKRN